MTEAPAARPFLKWAGGKRQLLPELLARAPGSFGCFHEPFLGGGAMFFALRPRRAVLSDTNERLVRAYFGVRDHVDEVMRLLRGYPHDRDFFLEMRARDIDRAENPEIAAWLIYLNRTGFNGLYRVNSKNRFNVPFGRHVNPTLCDEPNLRACAAALASVEIVLGDFVKAAFRTNRGDFVYLDPPYVPVSRSASFTAYTADGFLREDQERLRDMARELKKRGVHVLVSNSATDLVRELYASDFEMAEVPARRAINSRASGRGPVNELLCW